MKINHRVAFQSSPGLAAEWARWGVAVSPTGLVSLDVDEEDPFWLEISHWIKNNEAFDFVLAEFSPHDLAEADWLELATDWHHGYPQPREGSFGYREATYDLSDYCKKCGVGKRQKAAFQMKAEPKWGRKGILQLNWVFDEVFVTPQVWSSVFEPLGIGCRPVLRARGGELETVVQLVVEEQVAVAASGLPAEVCDVCGKTKYLPVRRVLMPALMSEPLGHAVRTAEWFGSGAEARRPLLVSQQVYQRLVTEKVRGAHMWPVSKGAQR